MIVWHVCSIKKFQKYLEQGKINKPVRAWEDIGEAERFSKQTGRQIILRLKFPNETPKLFGHKNKARILSYSFALNDYLFPHKKQFFKKVEKAKQEIAKRISGAGLNEFA